MFISDNTKNFCWWVLDFVEVFLEGKEEISGKMGTVREKIGKEGFEITHQYIYDSLSRRG